MHRFKELQTPNEISVIRYFILERISINKLINEGEYAKIF